MMRLVYRGVIVALLGLCAAAALCAPVWSADARYSARQYQQRQQEIIARAQQEQLAARQQAAQQQRQLLKDKKALQQALKQARDRVHQLQRDNAALKQQQRQLLDQQQKLRREKEKRTQRLNELVGFIHNSARDAVAMLRQSQLNALQPQRCQKLQPLLRQQRFPAMDDVRNLRDLLLQQMRLNGEVQLVPMTILDRKGEETRAQVLVLGSFSAAYRCADETGFLLYSPPSARFFALSVLPGRGLRSQLEDYFAGKTDSVPIDIGHGSSLRQLTYSVGLDEQLSQGGVIVWPILAIGVVAMILIGERVWFLRRNRFDAEGLLQGLRSRIRADEWEQSVLLCQQNGDKPLPRVLLAGLRYSKMAREDMENGLQEAILAEIPRLERFLSTLAVMASIAPLLGLLGTVTGMINTFQVITFHGTSDPRLMSGGISEALVTTMLGLAVAIPIMFSHSLLSRRVETIIAQLEEKSISFVNMVCQVRHGGGNEGGEC